MTIIAIRAVIIKAGKVAYFPTANALPVSRLKVNCPRRAMKMAIDMAVPDWLQSLERHMPMVFQRVTLLLHSSIFRATGIPALTVI